MQDTADLFNWFIFSDNLLLKRFIVLTSVCSFFLFFLSMLSCTHPADSRLEQTPSEADEWFDCQSLQDLQCFHHLAGAAQGPH